MSDKTESKLACLIEGQRLPFYSYETCNVQCNVIVGMKSTDRFHFGGNI